MTSAGSYIQCAQLGVGVLIVHALLERAHGFLRLDCLRPDDIGDLEIEGNVLAVAAVLEATQDEGGFGRGGGWYRLLLVAFSICSSRALLAPEDHQVIILDEFLAEDMDREGRWIWRQGGRSH